MAAMRVEDLVDVLRRLPQDANVVVQSVNWVDDLDEWHAVEYGVTLNEENNEVILYQGERVRTEEF